MMPGMEINQSECCCGSMHRMPETQDLQHEDEHRSDGSNSPICGELLKNCCKVEVSFDIDDAEDNEPIAANNASIKVPLSAVKILDDPRLFWDLKFMNDVLVLTKVYYIDIPPDPQVLVSNTPLYIKTERIRI